jgi:ureidoacrylate peracid hydrolase
MGVGEPVTTPDGQESRILIEETWNTDILAELTPEPGDLIVVKHRFSGFFETNLDALLKDLGVTTLVFTGCTTSVCVESTLRDAFFRDYRCLVLADCTAEPIGHGLERSNHDASLFLIQLMFGWVSDSGAFIEALAEQTTAAAN